VKPHPGASTFDMSSSIISAFTSAFGGEGDLAFTRDVAGDGDFSFN